MKNLFTLLFLLVGSLGWAQLPGDCDCDFDLDSDEFICAVDAEGTSYPVPNACVAECFGLTITDEPCDDFEWPEDDEWDYEDDCECDDADWESEGVCIELVEGDELYISWLPSECYAACWGYEDYTIVDCDYDWDDDWDWEDDCECDDADWESEGICIEYADGDQVWTDWLPSECYAACWGYTDYTLVDCDYDWEWEDDCACDDADWESEGICIELISEGETVICWVPSECYADCLGYEDYTVVDCEYDDWSYEGDCECEESDWESDGLCIMIESDGGSSYQWVPSECYADCWGYTDYAVVPCDFDFYDDWEYEDECECDDSDWDSEGLCIEVSDGEFSWIEWVPSECYAACWGYTDYAVVDCDWGYDDECGCDDSDWDSEGICIEISNEGFSWKEWVPSECYADCWGYEDYTVVDCDQAWEEDDYEWDTELDPCIEASLDQETLQGFIIGLADCGFELPACILNAPLFDNDEDFLNYLLENCEDGMGMITDGSDGQSLLGRYQESINSSASTATNDIIEGLDMVVLGNPVVDQLNIKLTSDNELDVKVNIISLNGSVQSSRSEKIYTGANILRFETQNLSSGIYLISVQNELGSNTMKFTVKH